MDLLSAVILYLIFQIQNSNSVLISFVDSNIEPKSRNYIPLIHTCHDGIGDYTIDSIISI